MAPASINRGGAATHEIPPEPHTQPYGPTSQQHTGLSSRYRPIAPDPPAIPSDPQTFPILPEQLERRLEQVQQRLINSVATQSFPVSGSVPSSSPGRILVLNPPPGMIPTACAFHASALGMPPMAEYIQCLARYLDEMTPNKRGKALIDTVLLKRIKLILVLHRKGFSGSGEASSDSESAPPVPYGTGGTWDTQPFRRWVRNTFVYRPATRTELGRAIDFGLLSPPKSSLSGPGVPGHIPSAGLTCSRMLVFHQDQPVALVSRTYKIILRAHWITNHAGRDRTWAMVREVCSYIPKCLVYDFVAACPTCRLARSKQFGIYTGGTRLISTAGAGPPLKLGKSHHEPQIEGDEGNLNARDEPPPILPVSSYGTPPEGWIPRIGPDGPLHSYPTQTSMHPLWQHHEINIPTSTDAKSNLPLGPVILPPFSTLLPPAVPTPRQAGDCSRRPNFQDLLDFQQETPALERQYPSWTGISELIVRMARFEQDKGMEAPSDSPTPRRKGGPSTLVKPVGIIRADVGLETTASIPWGQAHQGEEDTRMEIE